jgi:hypothetical protein
MFFAPSWSSAIVLVRHHHSAVAHVVDNGYNLYSMHDGVIVGSGLYVSLGGCVGSIAGSCSVARFDAAERIMLAMSWHPNLC